MHTQTEQATASEKNEECQSVYIIGDKSRSSISHLTLCDDAAACALFSCTPVVIAHMAANFSDVDSPILNKLLRMSVLR
jgi:hypothetical protein